MLKFIIIKTKDKVLISDDIENKSYNTTIPQLKFDGVDAKPTFKRNWYELENIPNIITQKSNDTYNNYRYIIKSGYPTNEMIPEIIYLNDLDDTQYASIRGMYDRTFDRIEGTYEEIEFEYDILLEDENFCIENPKYPFTVKIIDQITTHPILHYQRPSSISGSDFYNIIRKYVKENIDLKYAKITSDYDFCFTVKKIIRYSEPEAYTVNIGKRKPKYETRYRLNRDVEIFESAPKSYNGYTTQQGISGDNYKDLEEKIDKYLLDLITEINKPLVDCSCCKGLGVILDK